MGLTSAKSRSTDDRDPREKDAIYVRPATELRRRGGFFLSIRTLPLCLHLKKKLQVLYFLLVLRLLLF